MTSVRLLAASFALLSGAAAAHAHAYLDHASPLVGSTVRGSPSEVRLWFTQSLESHFTSAQVHSSSGAVVGTGGVDAADPKQIVIRVHALPPGSYKVFWKVLSVDTHRTEGSFAFEVKP
jgi:methionine-rich copper-binding protein CopC